MTDFFISYTAVDKQWAEWIAWHLEAAGYTTLIQAWDFTAGVDFIEEMDRAATTADRTLAVLSSDYFTSAFTMPEWGAAFRRSRQSGDRVLVPVRVQECDVPGLLGSIVYIDLVGLDETVARDTLLTGVRRERAKPQTPPHFPSSSDDSASKPYFPGAWDRPLTLEGAESLLAALPLDTIPDVATLPPTSRMPLTQNPLFVGRESDLMAVAAALKGNSVTAAIGQIAAATGLGGIGKTQLASEFVHRYGPFFAGGVFWMSFADPATVPTEVAACGGVGGMELRADFDHMPLEDQVRLVQTAWQEPLPRLLVFDNCEEESLLVQWRPATGGSRVLVTSRRSQWDASLGVQPLTLDILPRGESVALLCRHRSDLPGDDATLNAIAAELGDLPLALHLAGSYLTRYRHAVTPDQYLAQLQQPNILQHRSLQGYQLVEAVSPTQHEQHVGRTFALSYERLDAADATDVRAQALLARAAYFAPGELIPRALLIATLDLDDAKAETPEQTEDALVRLVELGLLEVEATGALRLHRLLATFVQADTARSEAQAAVEATLLEIALRIDNSGDPRPLLAWQSHLRATTERAQLREDKGAARLCIALGAHLRIIGDYDGAKPYYERALSIYESVLGVEHPDTATSLNNLGRLLQAQGDLDGAKPYLERALSIYESVLDGEDPDTATSLNNLGALLQAQGDLDEARPYYVRALSIRESVLGVEHPDTAMSLNNLGSLLQDQGDLGGAKPYLERALSIYELVLGGEHPNTQTVRGNLAALLSAQHATGDEPSEG